ncbi:MAG: hypothetical protein KBA51_09685 [Kiritimatiellae bacterium]|nr:hypothetical protein [Kiritimatiellia bacterium]
MNRRLILAVAMIWTLETHAASVSKPANPDGPSLPAEVESLLREAAEEGLPVRGLRAKAAEGLAKRAPTEAIASACRARRDALRKAREMAGSHGVHAVLLESLGRCLESGLSGDIVNEVLQTGTQQGVPPGRLAAVLDAGEDAVLSGLSAEESRLLMLELMSRKAGRREGRLAVERARQLKCEGAQGESLRRRLWGGRSNSDTEGCPANSEPSPRMHEGKGRRGNGGGMGVGNRGRGTAPTE